MKLSDVERLTAANACYAMACYRFADMINRENRGRSFDWNTFAEDMAERCEVEIILYLSTYGWPEDKIKTLNSVARDFGREIATMMVNRSGVCNPE